MADLKLSQNLTEFVQEFNSLLPDYSSTFTRFDFNQVGYNVRKSMIMVSEEDDGSGLIFGFIKDGTAVSLRSRLLFKHIRNAHFAKLCTAKLKYEILGSSDMDEVRPAILDAICMDLAKALNAYTYIFTDLEHCEIGDFEIALGSSNKVSCNRGINLGDFEVLARANSITEASKFMERCIKDEMRGSFIKNYVKDFSNEFKRLVESYIYKSGISAFVDTTGGDSVLVRVNNSIEITIRQVNNDYICSISSTGEEFVLSEISYNDFSHGGNDLLFNLLKCIVYCFTNDGSCTFDDIYKLLQIRDYFKKAGVGKDLKVDYRGSSPMLWIDNRFSINTEHMKFSLYADREWCSISIVDASNPEKFKAFEDECLESMNSGARHDKDTGDVKYYDDDFFKFTLIPKAKQRGVEISITNKTKAGVEFTVGGTDFEFDFLDVNDSKITVKGKNKVYQLSKDLFDYANLKTGRDPVYKTRVNVIIDIIAYYSDNKSNDNIVKLYNFTNDIVKDLNGKLYFGDKTYDSRGENGSPTVVFLSGDNTKFVMSICNKEFVCVCDDGDSETMPELATLSDPDLKKIIRVYINNHSSSSNKASYVDSTADCSDLRIVTLKFNDNIVGYRIKGSGMSPVDISRESAERHGVSNLKITKVINLVEGDEVLMSSSEKKSGKLCEDISDNDAMIDDFFKKLR